MHTRSQDACHTIQLSKSSKLEVVSRRTDHLHRSLGRRATLPLLLRFIHKTVEMIGIEPTTSALQGQRSPN
jgi:hypothetical protein